ncbi:MAG: universal stress protein [Sinimarinibacterium sp.]|jgi:universal stress protein E
MNRLERLLVVVDRGMRSTPALRRGVELARRASAALQLCLFDHHPLIDATADIVDPEVMRLAKTQFVAERTRWLNQQCDTLVAQGLRVTGEVRWAPALHDALLDRVLEHRPDLAIKDADPDSAHAHAWMTAADWKALRFCPAPLMLVRPQSAPLPRRILVAVDTAGDPAQKTALNDALMAMAAQLGLFCDAEVHVAHAFPFSAPVPERMRGVLSVAYEDMRRRDSEQFHAFAAGHRIAAERRHLLTGEPAVTIADFARRGDFDLLIVGAVYRSAFDRFFLGSTAETLIVQASCDVLIVKPPAFPDELAHHVDIEALRQRQAVLQLGSGLAGNA